MKQLIIIIQGRISVLQKPWSSKRTAGDDGHWASLLAAAKREGGAKIPAVTRGSLGKGREKGRERTRGV